MAIWDRLSKSVRDAIEREGGLGGGRDGRDGRTGASPAGLADKLGLVRITDEALGVELERRRRARGKAAHRRPAAEEELLAMAEARRARIHAQTSAKAYACLEIPAGAGRTEIERAYRSLLRQYHPDRHLGDREQHQSAVALALSLTDSYLALLQRR